MEKKTKKATLTIIIGLPGSGKSHLLKQLKKKATGVVSDDFMKNIAADSPVQRDPTVTDSRLYPNLIKDLRNGKNCIISDIIFCDSLVRAELDLVVTRDVKNLKLVWIFFENNPNQCEKNARKRKKPTLKRELKLINFLSKKYFLPEGIKTRKVWSS